MPDKSWKAFERRLAKRVGGKRIPVTGLDRAGADVVAGPFVYQAKLRRGLPSYLREWLRGIVAAGERKNAIGIVVWKAPRALDDDALVILRLKDWQALHGSGKNETPDPIKSSVSFKSAPPAKRGNLKGVSDADYCRSCGFQSSSFTSSPQKASAAAWDKRRGRKFTATDCADS